MDINRLNYRQLQIEAKKLGIRANLKIDVLRARVLEALQSTERTVGQNDSFTIAETDDEVTEHQEENLQDHIQEPISADCSFNQNFASSSTEDIYKMFRSTKRKSRFFSEILNISSDPHPPDADESDDIIEMKDDEKSSRSSVNSVENLVECCSASNRELNKTFEMNEVQIKESLITEEQRKVHTVKENDRRTTQKRHLLKTAYELARKTKKSIDQKALSTVVGESSNNKVRKISSKDSVIVKRREDEMPSKWKKPFSIKKNVCNTTKSANNLVGEAVEDDSMGNLKNLSGKTMYKTKPIRRSLLPVLVKPNAEKNKNASTLSNWKK